MRTHERDYRYLLLHVVPHHRLSQDLRRRVDRALTTGNAGDLRRQSVRALEELCAGDYLTRVGVHPDNGDVIVDYRKRGGRFRLSIAVPTEEWRSLTELAAGGSEVRRVPIAPPPEAPPVSAAPTDFEFIGEIVRSFAIADRSEPVLARLEALIDTITRVLDLVGAQLFLLDDFVAESEARGKFVRVLPDAELRATDAFRGTIESGAPRLMTREEVDAEGGGVAGDDWSVVGVVPIFSMGKVHGVLCALFAPGLPQLEMTTRLDVAGDTVRRIIEYHNQIENMTSFDGLTGMYNRHVYDDQLPVEVERAMRQGGVVSMLVIDIDDFKRVNDELGHKKGDEALGAIADLIRRNLRKVDLPFRYGGEELVILLPGTSELESVHTGERLRRVIEEFEGFKDQRGQARLLTVSVGVSVFPDTARTSEELFNQADAAMYRAKQQGKNRVVLYREGMELGPV